MEFGPHVSLWPHSLAPFCSLLYADSHHWTDNRLLLLSHSRTVPTPGPLHVLCLQAGMLLPWLKPSLESAQWNSNTISSYLMLSPHLLTVSVIVNYSVFFWNDHSLIEWWFHKHILFITSVPCQKGHKD